MAAIQNSGIVAEAKITQMQPNFSVSCICSQREVFAHFKIGLQAFLKGGRNEDDRNAILHCAMLLAHST